MGYARRIETPAAATDLVGLFKRELQSCDLKPGELCLAVTDTAFNPVYAAACTGAAMELGADAYQMVLSSAHPLPTKSIGAAWQEADLLVFMTTHTLHYHAAMRAALDRGVRSLAAMQPVPVLSRLPADPEVKRRTVAGARLMEQARRIRIVSDSGTDLVMDKGARPAVAHYGAAEVPGRLDFWPSGMVETAQLEGSLEGRLVMETGDCIFHLGRYVERPLSITFAGGKAVRFEGGVDAFLLKSYLESFGDENALMAGHTTWGTDHRCIWAAGAVQYPEATGGGPDAEAYLGEVQIEIGSNCDILFQGKNVTRAHVGLCCLNHTLWLDDQIILDHGRFVPEELQ